MPWVSPWGATSPVWWHMLEMGDTAKGMWWLGHRAQLPQPPRRGFLEDFSFQSGFLLHPSMSPFLPQCLAASPPSPSPSPRWRT